MRLFAFVLLFVGMLSAPIFADSLNVSCVGRALGGPCYATFTVGDYCYIGGGGRFMVMDISDPTSPTEVGHCYTPGIIEDIFVSSSYAYVADSSDGLYILDVSHFTSIEENDVQKPRTFSLTVYPNPFNASMSIKYNLSSATDVSLDIYDILGHRVTTLVSEHQPAGSYTVQWAPEDLPSGLYFVRMKAGKQTITKKAMYLK